MRLFFLAISFFLSFGSLYGQSQLDSLRQQYEQAVDGSRDEADKLFQYLVNMFITDKKGIAGLAGELVEKSALTKDTTLLIRSYILNGEILTKEGKIDSAITALRKGIEIGEAFGDTTRLIPLHRTISATYFFDKDMKNAFAHLLLAANLLNGCSNCPDDNKSNIYDDLAWYYHFASNDGDKALFWVRKQMDLVKKGKNVQHLVTVNNRLCEIFLKAGNLDSARQYCPVALEIAEKNDFKSTIAFSKVYNVRLKLMEGRTEQALSLGLDAIKTNEEYGYSNNIIAAYNAVAEAYMKMGENNKALSLLQRMPVKVESNDFLDIIELQVYHQLMAQLLEYNDPAGAIVHFRRAAGIRDTIQQEMYNLGLASIEVESKLAEKALENQRLQFEKEKETERVKRFKIALFATAVVLLLLALAAIYIYKTAQKNKRLAEELGTSNQLLEQKSEALAAANADLELFSYSLAHDIQSYVAQALNYTFFLDEKPGALPPDKERDFMGKARRSIKGLSSFCRDLIAYARMGQDASAPEEVELGEVLAEVRLALQSHIEEAGVELTVQENLPEVIAHRPRMVQLFQNLIGNAVKYRRAGVVPEVKLAFEEKDGEYLFTVSDNGQGIPEERISRLFDLFVKGDMGGSGIGLAVCRRIVEGYGGRIWVASELGVGSSFCFTLPA